MRGLGWVVPLAVAVAGLGCGTRPVSHTVVMSGIAYAPLAVQAAAGDTVVFRNDDPVPHTVTADHGAFDSGDVLPGRSWRWVARQKGRQGYHCTYHPNMTGTLVIH